MIRYHELERFLHLLGPVDEALFDKESSLFSNDLDSFQVRSSMSKSGHAQFVPFSESTYYDLNPDVAANGIEGLKHYFRHGFSEGRPVRQQDGRNGTKGP